MIPAETSAELIAGRPTEAAAASTVRRAAYRSSLLIGLGGLFAGVTGPLLSNYVPILVRDALGEQRTLIGGVMAIDNVLLLLLVPWAGIASDRAVNRGGSRLPLVLAGYLLAAVGMAAFPFSAAFGIAGIIAAIVVLYSGLNVQRSPFQALMVDLVPSRYRSLATASVMFQMCVGAIVFLMLGRMLGMQPAFLADHVVLGGGREPAALPAEPLRADPPARGGAGRGAVRPRRSRGRAD